MTKGYEITDGILRVDLGLLSAEAQAVVGIDFNPSGEKQIDLVKAICAAVVDIGIKGHDSSPANSLQQRAFRDGLAHLEAAQMFLVKAIVHRTKGR